VTKTFVLSVENLNSSEDATKIEDYFLSRPGVEKVTVEMDLKIVSLSYNESVGSPKKLLEAFGTLGYPVR